jgi:hypothetical protein
MLSYNLQHQSWLIFSSVYDCTMCTYNIVYFEMRGREGKYTKWVTCKDFIRAAGLHQDQAYMTVEDLFEITHPPPPQES